MARYNVRDLIGHWVKPRSAAGKMCPHACCRGHRVHPANMPVVLPDKLLRRASDDDLAEHFRKVAGQRTEAETAAYWQALAEMERRDVAGERRERAQEARRARWAASRMDRDAIIENSWLTAENATKGNMLNKRGRAAGIDDRSLFRGPESRARLYASEELLAHWQTHPRPTEAMLAGRDTRVYEQYSAPRRARAERRDAWRVKMWS